MKTVTRSCKLCSTLYRYVVAIVSKLMCFISKRKLSIGHEHRTALPFSSIHIDNGQHSKEINVVEWNTWEDENKKDLQPDDIPAADLFKDMEPVIDKTKVVQVTRKVKAPVQSPTSPFSFQHKSAFQPVKYEIQTELETWSDEPAGWDDGINENEISEVTNTMLKENKRVEREKRMSEQKQKRLDREQSKGQRRQESIAIKLS